MSTVLAEHSGAQRTEPGRPLDSSWLALGLLLVVASALRASLALAGGQQFWPDEDLGRSHNLLRYLGQIDLASAIQVLVDAPNHTGFVLVGALPALVGKIALALGASEPSAESVSALVLSQASAGAIALCYLVARRFGAGTREALAATFLMVASTSMLYYSRHLLPYDSALLLALVALYLGLARPASLRRSFLVGILAGLALMTYNGYWALALTVVALHLSFVHKRFPSSVLHAAVCGLGLPVLPVALTVASFALGTTPYLLAMARFAGTINEGNFAEGWRLPWVYLWHTEHGVLLVWLAGLAVAAWCAWRGPPAARTRAAAWLGAVLFIYLLLVLSSVGLQVFVVYGRLVRQMVPFLCLATAAAAAAAASQWRLPPRLALLTALALTIQAALNMRTPLLQRFPNDVRQALAARYQPLAFQTTLGPVRGEPGDASRARYILLNAQHLCCFKGQEPNPPPDGQTLFETPHPLQYLPYQYEGYDPSERELLRSSDIRIRLIDTRGE